MVIIMMDSEVLYLSCIDVQTADLKGSFRIVKCEKPGIPCLCDRGGGPHIFLLYLLYSDYMITLFSFSFFQKLVNDVFQTMWFTPLSMRDKDSAKLIQRVVNITEVVSIHLLS